MSNRNVSLKIIDSAIWENFGFNATEAELKQIELELSESNVLLEHNQNAFSAFCQFIKGIRNSDVTSYQRLREFWTVFATFSLLHNAAETRAVANNGTTRVPQTMHVRVQTDYVRHIDKAVNTTSKNPGRDSAVTSRLCHSARFSTTEHDINLDTLREEGSTIDL